MKEGGPTVDQAEEENIKDKEIVAGLDEDTQFFVEDTKQVCIRFTLKDLTQKPRHGFSSIMSFESPVNCESHCPVLRFLKYS